MTEQTIHLSALVMGIGWAGAASLSVVTAMGAGGADVTLGTEGSGKSSGSSGQPKASLVLMYILTESIMVMLPASALGPTVNNKKYIIHINEHSIWVKQSQY